jgi:hypothetical protein
MLSQDKYHRSSKGKVNMLPRSSFSLRPMKLIPVCLVVASLTLLLLYRPNDFGSSSFGSIPLLFAPQSCPTLGQGQGHESIRCSIKEAEYKHQQQLSRQSRTPKEAIETYRTRYKREPPARFEQWAQYAIEKQAAIIDDYDQIEADMLPFRSINGSVLKTRMENTLTAANNALMQKWSIKDGVVSIKSVSSFPNPSGHIPTLLTYSIVKSIEHLLPDMIAIFNWDDRHRVTQPDNEDTFNTRIGEMHFGAREAWDSLTRNCPDYHLAKNAATSNRPSVDLCQYKTDGEFRYQHGMFAMGGHTFSSIVPVMSLAKLSTYLDVIAPTWCYADNPYRLWKDSDAVPFTEKKSAIYWRGSSTGMTMFDNEWRNGHRQRLAIVVDKWVKSSQKLFSPKNLLTAIRKSSRPPSRLASQNEALSRLPPETFDIMLTKLMGCEERPDDKRCLQLASMVPLAEYSPPYNAFKNKFLLDVDGNSMSCRFYRLLDSNSMVFKQTVWGEWHDERIVPWLHYVPVSLGMDELPQLLDYFINTPEGRLDAEKIATQGRLWAARGLRKIDLTVYYYRLFLELASILNQS